MVNKELLFHSFIQQICVCSLERGGIRAKPQDIRVTKTNTVSHSHRWLQVGGERWARESKYTHGSCYAERDTEGNEVGWWQGEWSPHGRDFSGQRHRKSCPAVTVSWYLRGWAEFWGWPLRSSRRGGVRAEELGGVQEGRKYLWGGGAERLAWLEHGKPGPVTVEDQMGISRNLGFHPK